MASKAAGTIHVVAGTDDGLVKQEALALHRELTGGVDDGFTHETIDGTADNSEEAFQRCKAAVESLLTLPFFGGEKVVWLKNATFLADDVTGRSERTLSGVESLRNILELGLPRGVHFLLSTPAIDKRRTFWKFLNSNAQIRIFDKIDTSREGWEEQVAMMVERRARELKLRFEPEALELFVMLAGEATQQIDAELEKLDLYLGEQCREATVDDVRKMVPLSRAGIVFEIGNALQQGDAARALELIDQQLERGESAIGILRASVIPTVRNLFFARMLADQKVPTGNYKAFAAALDNRPESERAWLPQKKAGGVNVYPIFLSLRAASSFTLESLRGILESTAKADKALVTTGLDHRLVLHRIIVEMASAAKSKRR